MDGVPDIHEEMGIFTHFAAADLKDILERITLTMKVIRKRHDWKRSDVEALKEARRQLHPFIERLRTGRMRDDEHAYLQKLMDMAVSLNLASLDDLKKTPEYVVDALSKRA